MDFIFNLSRSATTLTTAQPAPVQSGLLLPVAHFSKLRSFAQRMISRFGSTYRCEQSFSTMKIIKSKDRSRLRDSNLKNLLTLATTKVEPEITKLASRKQVHNNYH